MTLDISKAFTPPTYLTQKAAKGLIEREGTADAITYFAEVQETLDDYSYWFLLSTCWVSYAGHSDLQLWRKLFSSMRSKRKQSIMKPSELKEFERLPYSITVYRAHRFGETDWIAYTLDPIIAARFARERNVSEVKEYRVKKRDVLALFTRRGEKEIIVLDKGKAEFIRAIEVIEHGTV